MVKEDKVYKLRTTNTKDFRELSRTNDSIWKLIGFRNVSFIRAPMSKAICGISHEGRSYCADYFGCKSSYACILSETELKTYFVLVTAGSEKADKTSKEISELEKLFNAFMTKETFMDAKALGVSDFASLREWDKKRRAKIKSEITKLKKKIAELEKELI